VFGQTVHFIRRIFPDTSFRLQPGERKVVIAIMCFETKKEGLGERVQRLLEPGTVDKIILQERAFYKKVVPEFHCSDKMIEKIYYYRQYILRRNLACPGVGFLKYPVFYEGKQAGYSRLITASSSLILDEARWWRDPIYGFGHIKNCTENLPDHGIFRDIWINQVRDLSWPGYEEWIPRSMADSPATKPRNGISSAGMGRVTALIREPTR